MVSISVWCAGHDQRLERSQDQEQKLFSEIDIARRSGFVAGRTEQGQEPIAGLGRVLGPDLANDRDLVRADERGPTCSLNAEEPFQDLLPGHERERAVVMSCDVLPLSIERPGDGTVRRSSWRRSGSSFDALEPVPELAQGFEMIKSRNRSSLPCSCPYSTVQVQHPEPGTADPQEGSCARSMTSGHSAFALARCGRA